MSEIHLSGSAPPETILEPEPADAIAALAEAGQDREAVAEVVERWPRCLDAWAALGALGRDRIERYAAYRVGYHRGLDRLRQSGWRGSGFVRWANPTNRGFLRCLAGLQSLAAEIGEHDEATRCAQFLRQLDPDWPPADLPGEVG